MRPEAWSATRLCRRAPGARVSMMRDSELGTRDSEPGTRDSGLGTRNSGLGTRNSELGTRNSELGTRNSKPGHDKALTDIERGFQVLKSDTEIAPVRRRLPERIRAHALIGFFGLAVASRAANGAQGDSQPAIPAARPGVAASNPATARDCGTATHHPYQPNSSRAAWHLAAAKIAATRDQRSTRHCSDNAAMRA
jgi:hypothetical protein